MRISDWISDVCSSDLVCLEAFAAALLDKIGRILWLDTNIPGHLVVSDAERRILYSPRIEGKPVVAEIPIGPNSKAVSVDSDAGYLIEQRSEEHTSELQSLMRISYADFCLKKKTI